MKRVLVDTNVLVALIDEKDKWHSLATEIRDLLKSQNAALIFCDCVVNETVAVIGRRLEEKGLSEEFPAVLTRLELLITPQNITWTYSEIKRLYQSILNLIREHKGKLNFHDSLIVLIAKETDTQYIASFDADFDIFPWLKRIKNHSAEVFLSEQKEKDNK
jgi:predicted nucleic acid-binding protein